MGDGTSVVPTASIISTCKNTWQLVHNLAVLLSHTNMQSAALAPASLASQQEHQHLAVLFDT